MTSDVYTDIYGDLYGRQAFPQGILDLKVELSLSGTWTDITPYVYQGRSGPGCVISRGHPDESTTANPSTLGMVLNNRDGRFSSRYPAGPYYGSLGRNTPVRVSVPEGSGTTYLRSETDQTSYASCPDSAGVSVTGDTELQIDLTLSNWRAATILAAKWADTSNQRSWLLLLDEAGTLTFKWSANGSTITTATSTAAVPVPALRRQAVKVTLAVASGTVTFYTAPAATGQSGPITTGWVIVGAAVVAGAANVFDSTAQVQAGYCSDAATEASTYTGYYGKLHSFKLLSGIAGTTKASPDFTARAPAASAFADAQSNTWTLRGTSELSDRKYRFHGEVSAWPQAWDPTGTDVYVNITAGGLLRRYSQNNAATSALTRYWSKLSAAPVAYWPCEDLAGAATIASGLVTGTAMRFTGSPTLASSSAFAASSALPVINGSTWTGIVQPYSSGTDCQMIFLVSIPSGGFTDSTTIAGMFTSGDVVVSYIDYNVGSGGQLTLAGLDSTRAASILDSITGVNGKSVAVSVALRKSGSDIAWVFQVLEAGATSATTHTGTVFSASPGVMTIVTVNDGYAYDAITTPVPSSFTTGVVGQIALRSAYASLSGLSGPLAAYAGETAGARFSRLCSEEGVAFRGQGLLSATTAMGAQPASAVATLLQECEDADRGMIVEPRQVLGLGYRTRGSLRNQSAALALSYTSAHLAGTLTPTDDDQYTTNDVTVTRTGGSNARQVKTSGALSTAAPPSGVGTYATSTTINLWQDDQALQQAGWLLHMGTVDQPRYPLMQVSLARTEVTSLYSDLQDAELGDRLTVTGTPAWLPPDGITQLIQGLGERLGGYTFEIDWQGVPESPYKTAIVGDTTFGHVETDGSTLAANIASGAASMSVATTTSGTPIWTTTDVPFDVIMSGERITVTAISGSSSPQTFTITRAVNGVAKAHTAGEAVSLFYPATLV